MEEAPAAQNRAGLPEERRMATEPSDHGARPLLPSQRGLGDMQPEEFRAAAHGVADRVADYLERLESYPVLPPAGAGLDPRRAPGRAARAARAAGARSSPTTRG